jgi:hypothetical protein
VEDIYAQLVCSSVSFDLADRQIINPVENTAVSASNTRENKIVFTQKIKESNEFVGVKAVNNKTGEIVYYKPVEIMTVWGQLSKQGKGHSKLLLAILGAFMLCCCIMICYRRKTRGSSSEYSPLSGM